MTNNSVFRAFRPLMVIFIATTALLITNRARLSQWDADVDVLIIGNLVLFAATALSFYLFTRQLNSKNAQAVVRTVYGGVLSKMVVCLLTVFVYISVAGKGVNKAGVFGCMFLYMLYTTFEVIAVMKLSKQKKNV
ncbi:hypothetical protein FAM09_00765 [Niastella caeni]|uniref:ATP synthase subunit I n=1 Tax=Niastella caeni TaxID=2569763 RepID=A0A4S8I0J0_9BACT|nr:hypothetical protein [Niastella caeni]THU40679.1 hypothetical protein FAM09_00765 [Niastella caeni]